MVLGTCHDGPDAGVRAVANKWRAIENGLKLVHESFCGSLPARSIAEREESSGPGETVAISKKKEARKRLKTVPFKGRWNGATKSMST